MHAASDLLRQADALLASQRHAEATVAYEAALAADPSQADGWFNLGYLLRRAGRFEHALDAYAHALRHGGRDPEQIHLNRAAILSEHLHRDPEALQELQRALAVAPAYLPALLNLGNLHEERGERDSAVACYQRMLDAAPGERSSLHGLQLEALARLVHLQPPRHVDDPQLHTLREATHLPGVDDETRANLLFSLGRAWERLGGHAQAFTAFAEAKQHAHRRFPAHDRMRAERLTEALMSTPASSPLAAPVARTGPAPLFICGMFRSGSTLLEQVLAMHPAIAAGGEMETLPRMVAVDLAPFPARLATLSAGERDTLAARYMHDLQTLAPSSAAIRYITDKRPDNYRLVGLIKHLFPDAKILHTRRAPLDTCLSIFMQHLNPRACPYAGTLADIGHEYLQYRRLIDHWSSAFADDIHHFDYDAFVAQPRETLEPLLRFLGLDWDPSLLDFHRSTGSVRTASYWQVRRPLYGDASGRWHRYAAELEPLRAMLSAGGIATG